MAKEKEREKEKQAKKERHVIEVHPELIAILEKIRKLLKSASWGVMDKNIKWRELTGVLARKINTGEINIA